VGAGKKGGVYEDGWVTLIPLVVDDAQEMFPDTLWSDIVLILV